MTGSTNIDLNSTNSYSRNDDRPLVNLSPDPSAKTDITLNKKSIDSTTNSMYIVTHKINVIITVNNDNAVMVTINNNGTNVACDI